MGNSSPASGPPSSNSLLPPDAPPPPLLPDEPDEKPNEGDEVGTQDEPSGGPDGQNDVAQHDARNNGDGTPHHTWQAARREAGRFASSGGRGGGPARVARSHVRAQGGAHRAALTARAGRTTLSNLGGFFSAVARDGALAAALQYGVRFVGQTVNGLLNELSRVLSFDGAIVDEAVARTALLDTLHEVFEVYDIESEGFEALNSLTPERVEAALELYVANYINAQLLYYLAGQPIENKAPDPQTAYALECELKVFVRGLVRLEFSGVDVLGVDWSGKQGQSLVQDLFERAFGIING